MVACFCFFFSSRRRHTRWNCDWSSDVCSSDLVPSLAWCTLSRAEFMWRLTYSFIGAMTITALPRNAISVYLFRDVDDARVGQWNLAYLELFEEFLILAAVAGIFVFLLTWIGRNLFRVQEIPPSPKLAF